MHLDELLKGNDTVQRHLAAERAAGLFVVSPLAREALEKEVFPQLEAGLDDVSTVDSILESSKTEILDAFKGKTSVYTSLVAYKSIDQSDDRFRDDLLHVLDEWGDLMKSTLGTGDVDSTQSEVKIHVDSEVTVKVEPGTNVEVETASPKPGQNRGGQSKVAWRAGTDEDVEVTPSEGDFDLNDMRL